MAQWKAVYKLIGGQNENSKPALLLPRAIPFEKATYAGGGGAT